MIGFVYYRKLIVGGVMLVANDDRYASDFCINTDVYCVTNTQLNEQKQIVLIILCQRLIWLITVYVVNTSEHEKSCGNFIDG